MSSEVTSGERTARQGKLALYVRSILDCKAMTGMGYALSSCLSTLTKESAYNLKALKILIFLVTIKAFKILIDSLTAVVEGSKLPLQLLDLIHDA